MGIRLPRALSIEPFKSDRRWLFDMAAEQLWETLHDIDEYPLWWPWLHSFEPVGGLEAGACWRCVVSPPLPYVVRFTVLLRSVDDFIVDSIVSGDIRGSATLRVEPVGTAASSISLRSSLEPADPVLRRAGKLARPLVEWGHDWVLDQGCRQFRQSVR